MYAIDLSTPSAEAAWACFAARRELEDAIAGLDAVHAVLGPLIGDTAWHSKGVAALNAMLVQLADSVLHERTRLRQQLWELESRSGE